MAYLWLPLCNAVLWWQRADAIRYLAIYHYGGIYADMDLQVRCWLRANGVATYLATHCVVLYSTQCVPMQPYESVEPYLRGTDTVVFETPNLGLTNMILAGT